MREYRAQIAALVVTALMISCTFYFFTDAFSSQDPEAADVDAAAATLGALPAGAIPISTAADVALIGSTGASGAYPLSGYYFLTNNITLINAHTSIGTSAAPFTGTFDGYGYTISGIVISTNNVGFFGYVTGGKITNLKVSGQGTNAGLVYTLNNSEISKCVNDIQLNYSLASGTSYFGGVVTIANNASVIQNCMNTANLNASGGNLYVAGIVGNLRDTSKIINCLNVGLISSDYPVRTYGINAAQSMTTSGPTVVNSYSNNGNNAASGYFIDGTSTPARLTSDPDQRTGVKISADLQPSLSAAQAGTSTYYTGSTKNNAGTFPGWDFVNTWTIDPSVNNGYPTLRAPAVPVYVTSSPPAAAVSGAAFSYQPITIPAGATISVSGAPWLSVAGGTISGTVPAPANGISETYTITVTAAAAGYESGTQTFVLTVYAKLTFLSSPGGGP